MRSGQSDDTAKAVEIASEIERIAIGNPAEALRLCVQHIAAGATLAERMIGTAATARVIDTLLRNMRGREIRPL